MVNIHSQSIINLPLIAVHWKPSLIQQFSKKSLKKLHTIKFFDLTTQHQERSVYHFYKQTPDFVIISFLLYFLDSSSSRKLFYIQQKTSTSNAPELYRSTLTATWNFTRSLLNPNWLYESRLLWFAEKPIVRWNGLGFGTIRKILSSKPKRSEEQLICFDWKI